MDSISALKASFTAADDLNTFATSAPNSLIAGSESVICAASGNKLVLENEIYRFESFSNLR